MGDLFGFERRHEGEGAPLPLAERMRPASLDEVIGQEHLVSATAPFRRALEAGRLGSVIFCGPPGVGKTTLARLVAARLGAPIVTASGASTSLADVKQALAAARRGGQRAALILDEIHRYSKTQQDALLAGVEDGSIVLLGCTTENPGFEIQRALLSRARVETLAALEPARIEAALARALADPTRGLGEVGVTAAPGALALLAEVAAGDLRRAYGLLEAAAAHARDGVLDVATARAAAGARVVSHDRAGDSHYDLLSALQKSVRGSDVQAALYYLARLLAGGEPCEVIVRRLVVMAAEDIGNADPQGLVLATATDHAVRLLGMPEARLPLSQLVIYLATAPKSNRAAVAIDRALDTVRDRPAEVPLWLRPGATALARQAGHGVGYLYPHDAPHGYVPIDYLPEVLGGEVFYSPGGVGFEREIAKRLAYWRSLWPPPSGQESP